MFLLFLFKLFLNLVSGHPFKPILHLFDMITLIFEHLLVFGSTKYSVLTVAFLLSHGLSHISPKFKKNQNPKQKNKSYLLRYNSYIIYPFRVHNSIKDIHSVTQPSPQSNYRIFWSSPKEPC